MCAHEFTRAVESGRKVGIIGSDVDPLGSRQDKELVPFLQGKRIGDVLRENDAERAAEFPYLESVGHGQLPLVRPGVTPVKH